jgi:predicted dehydrogenase
MPLARQSRRQFLRNLGTAAAFAPALVPAFVPAAALGRDATTPPPSARLAIGVVGCGYGLAVAKRFLAFPDVRVTALCDVDALRLERATAEINDFYKTPTATGWRDFREMFANAKLDAVVLAVPDHWHGLLALAALRSGIDVWGEPPLARTLAEGRAIAAAADNHGRVWQTNLWRRSVREYRQAADFVRSGALGLVSHIEVGGGIPQLPLLPKPADFGKPPATLDYEMWLGPGAWSEYDSRVVRHWQHVSLYGSGVLAGNAAHFIDIAQWALGTSFGGPTIVRGSGQFFEDALPFDVEHRYRVIFGYENGTALALSSALPKGVRFYGERGWLFIGDNAQLPPAADTARPKILASSNDILDELTALNDSERRRSFGGTDDHWRDFVDCAKTRRRCAAPPEIGHRVATTIHLARAAIQSGRKITWSPSEEKITNDDSDTTLTISLRPSIRLPWML